MKRIAAMVIASTVISGAFMNLDWSRVSAGTESGVPQPKSIVFCIPIPCFI